MSPPSLLWLTVVALGWVGHALHELLLDLELQHSGHDRAHVPQGLDHDVQPLLVLTTPGGHSLFHVLGTPPTACRHNLHVFHAGALLAVAGDDGVELKLAPLVAGHDGVEPQLVPLDAGFGWWPAQRLLASLLPCPARHSHVWLEWCEQS